MKLSLLQIIVIFILFLTPLFASMLPFIVQSYKTPPDRVFMGLHRWSEDYYSYLHTINEGLMGHFLTNGKLTLQPHPSNFIHSEYAIFGQIGRIFNLNSAVTYHLSRFFLGAVFLLSVFYFFLSFFKNQTKNVTTDTLLAFFLSFFVGSFPRIVSLSPLRFEPYLSWWAELDLTRRSTILPHYLLGNIFFLLILVVFTKLIKSKEFKIRHCLVLFLLSFLLSFVHPINYLLLLCVLGIFTLFNLPQKRIPIFFVITILSGLIPVLYYRYVFTLPFLRFVMAHGATTSYHIPLFEFMMTQGPVFFLGLVGMIYFLFRQKHLKNTPALLLFLWVFTQVLFFLFFYRVFNFDRLRTMQLGLFIPLSFFAVLLLKRLPRMIVIMIVIIITVISFPLSVQSIQKQIYEVSDFQSFSNFAFPSKKQYEAFLFLRNNTPDNSPITAAYEATFLIPSVSGNKIAFASNYDNDPDFHLGKKAVENLYRGIKLDEATAYLKKQGINLVFWGYQEKSYGGNLKASPLLRTLFENSEVTIFQII